jgi:hypothetical protein
MTQEEQPDINFFQTIYEYGIGIYKKIRGLSGGYRRRRGGQQSDAPSDLNGNYLVQRQLNATFLPLAAEILEGKPNVQTLPFIRYLLSGLIKWLGHLPSYESADNMSLWAPVFVEMARNIVEDPSNSSHIQLFLGFCLVETSSFELPDANWSGMEKEVGRRLLDFIFGEEAVELLLTVNMANIEGGIFRPNIDDYEVAYTSSYETAVNLLESVTNKSISVQPQTVQPQTVQPQTVSKNLIESTKSSSEPTEPASAEVQESVSNPKPMEERSPEESFRGGRLQNTRKIGRKRIQDNDRTAKRHRKLFTRRK